MASEKENSSVRVAVRVRPLIPQEKLQSCRECVSFAQDDPCVIVMGKDRQFTFDYVFPSSDEQVKVYEDAVRPLVQSCFGGYNATVLAYGQTGSGKTYTMGSGNNSNLTESELGVIPRVIREMFQTVRTHTESNVVFTLRCSFLEIHNDELHDLLDPDASFKKDSSKVVSIREDPNGGIFLTGIREEQVNSEEEMCELLERGCLSRTTGSTQMNQRSSRSHAIFSIVLEQRRSEAQVEAGSEFMTAKFHFVDLAGSERLKRTKAEGERLREGIHINGGLLALGNVISALGDEKRAGSHVPYRDSKLTRMLQDSLGGNSRTLMIACISPADVNFEETLNALKYANRARNIQNKPIVNRDPNSAQLVALRSKIQELEHELLKSRQSGGVFSDLYSNSDFAEEVQQLKSTNGKLEREAVNLKFELERAKQAMQELKERCLSAEEDRDRFRLRLEEITGKPVCVDETEAGSRMMLLEEQMGTIRMLERRNEELQGEVEETQRQLNIARETLDQDELIFREKIREISSLTRDKQELQAELNKRSATGPAPGPSSITPTHSTAAARSTPTTQLTSSPRSNSSASLPDTISANRSGPVRRTPPASPVVPSMSLYDADVETASIAGSVDEDTDDFSLDDASCMDDAEMGGDDEAMSAANDTKTREFTLSQRNLERQLKDLTVSIIDKEKLIGSMAKTQTELASMKSAYEVKIMELEADVRVTQTELEKVMNDMNTVESHTSEAKKKIKMQYDSKFAALEQQMASLRKHQQNQASVAKLKEQNVLKMNALQNEIAKFKQQKVLLVKKLKEEGDAHREYIANCRREITQLKKTNTKTSMMMKRLELDNQKKSALLKRRAEEVASMNRRLRVTAPARRMSPTSGVSAGPNIPKGPTPAFFASAAKMDAWVVQEVEAWVKKNEITERLRQQLVNQERAAKELEALLAKRDHLQLKVERAQGSAMPASHDDDSTQDASKDLEEVEDLIETAEAKLAFANSNIDKARKERDATCAEATDAAFNSTLEQLNVMESRRLSKVLFARVVRLKYSDNLLRNKVTQIETQLLESQTQLQNAINNQHSAQKECGRRITKLEEEHEEKLLFLLQQIDAGGHHHPTTGQTMSNAEVANAHRLLTLKEEQITILSRQNAKYVEANSYLQKEVDDIMTGKAAERKAYEEEIERLRRQLDAIRSGKFEIVERRRGTSDAGLASQENPSLQAQPRSPPFQDSSRGPIRESPPTVGGYDSSSSYSLDSSSSVRSSREDVRLSNVWSRLTDESSYTGVNRVKIQESHEIRQRNLQQPRTSRARSAPAATAVEEVQPQGAGPPPDDAPFYCTTNLTGHSGFVFSLATTHTFLFSGSQDNTVRVWDLHGDKEPYVTVLRGHTGFVRALAASPDGRMLYSGSQDKTIRLWDTRSWKCVQVMTGHTGEICSLYLHGSTLYSGADDNTIKMWVADSQQPIKSVSAHRSTVFALTVVNKSLFSGSRDHYVKVWDTDTLELKRTLQPPHLDGVSAFAVTPNFLLTGSRDKSIRQWDLGDLRTSRTCNAAAHADWICSLHAIDEINTLISTSRDCTARVWDLENPAECLGTLTGHKAAVNAVARQNEFLITGASDRVIKVWVGQQ